MICGYGRIGHTVCDQLAEAEVPFVVVDSCPTEIENATERGYLALLGNSTDDELLVAAGIERARGVICAINSDAENIFVILCARELNKDVFVATRASTDAAARRMERAGASLVVSPYTTAGQNIADAIVRPRLAEFLRTHRTDEYELSALIVKAGSSFEGRSIREVGEEFPSVVFVALERSGVPTLIRPGGNQAMQADDRITLAGAANDLEQVFAIQNACPSMA